MTEVLVHEMQYYGGKVTSDIEVVNYRGEYYNDYRRICCDCFRSLSIATNLDPDSFYTREEMINRKSHVFIMLINKEIVGSVEIVENVIEHLFVNEKYQNKGYGKKLLLFAINLLQQSGIEQIILYVADLNKEAIQLYLNNGFKCINTTKEIWG